MEKGFILENVTVASGGTSLLKNVSMGIPEGRVLLVAGESGSGKSSLGRVLTGLIPHQYPASISGSVRLDGDSLLTRTPEQLAGIVAHVAAEPWSRFFQVTVRDELAFGPRNLGWQRDRIESRVDETARVLDLIPFLDRRIDTLSAGQLQRVSIGTALAMECPWLILDEPSAYLDLSSLHALTEALEQIHQRCRISIVLLEHRIGDFAPLADDVAILSGGELVFHGPRKDFEAGSERLCHSYGLRRPDLHDPSAWDEVVSISSDQPCSEPLFRMEDVSFSYGRTKVLDALNLSVYPGEILALAGSNGSGKTTLGRIAAGLLKPDSGEVRLGGRGLKSADGRAAGMLFQNPSSMLFFESVGEEVHSGPGNYDLRLEEGEFEGLIEGLSLDGLLARHPQRLSRGQRLRVAVATVLILKPRLVILDEPIRGQDWRSLSRMIEYLREHSRRSGSACILITHEYKLVCHFADRIALLEGGAIRKIGTPMRKPDGEIDVG